LLYRGQVPELRPGLGPISSKVLGARCSEPGLPTGDGEAISHSAPLEPWSCSFSHRESLQNLVADCYALHVDQTPAAGDGELLSPSEPVGRPHSGSGAAPQCPGCHRFAVIVHHDVRLVSVVGVAGGRWSIPSSALGAHRGSR